MNEKKKKTSELNQKKKDHKLKHPQIMATMEVSHAAQFLPHDIGRYYPRVRAERQKVYTRLVKDARAALEGPDARLVGDRIPKSLLLVIINVCYPTMRKYDEDFSNYNCVAFFDRIVEALGHAFGNVKGKVRTLLVDSIFYDLYDQNAGEGFDEKLVSAPILDSSKRVMAENLRRVRARFTPLDEETIRSIVASQFRVPQVLVVQPAQNMSMYIAAFPGLDTEGRCLIKIGFSTAGVLSRLASSQQNNAYPMPLPLLEMRDGTVTGDLQATVVQRLQNVPGTCGSVRGFYKREGNKAAVQSSGYQMWLERAAQVEMMEFNVKVMGATPVSYPNEVFLAPVDRIVELVVYLRDTCGASLYAEPNWFEGIFAQSSTLHQAILPLCFPTPPTSPTSPTPMSPPPPTSSPTIIPVVTAVAVETVEAVTAVAVAATGDNTIKQQATNAASRPVKKQKT